MNPLNKGIHYRHLSEALMFNVFNDLEGILANCSIVLHLSCHPAMCLGLCGDQGGQEPPDEVRPTKHDAKEQHYWP